MKKKILSMVLIGIMTLGLTGCGNPELSSDEQVAWYTLRLAIAEARLSGQKTDLTQEHIKQLENMAKSTGKDWFSDLDGYFTGKEMDTDKYEITMICDDGYCATFKVEASGGLHLVDYTFEKSDEVGYSIHTTD